MEKDNKTLIKRSLYPPQKLYGQISIYEHFLDLLHQRRSCIELPDFLTPQIDIHETESSLTIEMELPGMGLQDISYRVEDDIIHIRGEKRRAAVVREGSYVRMERKYGTFARTFRLPTEVYAQRVHTTYSNGILTLTFIKTDALDTEEA